MIYVFEVKRWFDKINGNTYHSVRVFKDSKLLGQENLTYGYEEQYLNTAHQILQKSGEFPTTEEKLNSGMKADFYNFLQRQRENKSEFLILVADVNTKKGLTEGW